MPSFEGNWFSQIAGRRWLAVGIWTVSTFLAIVLSARAVAGAFDRPISGILPTTVTGVALFANLLAWSLFVRGLGDVASAEKRRFALGILSLVPPVVMGWATSVNAPAWSLGLSTGIVLLGLSWVIVCEAAAFSDDEGTNAKSTPLGGMLQQGDPFDVFNATKTVRLNAGRMTDSIEGLSADARTGGPSRFRQGSGAKAANVASTGESTLLQQLSRQIAPDGSERIEAILLARFQAGESEAVLHLPIHPALPSTPDVECEPLDESPVSVTVSAALPYGIRVAVTRQATSGELTVPIGIEAVAAASAAHAA